MKIEQKHSSKTLKIRKKEKIKDLVQNDMLIYLIFLIFTKKTHDRYIRLKRKDREKQNHELCLKL